MNYTTQKNNTDYSESTIDETSTHITAKCIWCNEMQTFSYDLVKRKYDLINDIYCHVVGCDCKILKVIKCIAYNQEEAYWTNES